MMSRAPSFLVAGAVVAVVTACGGERPPPVSPSTSTDAPSPPASWDALSHEQKRAYMQKAVLPKMGALLHEYDAKRFAAPTCATCHGAGAKDGSFKMPNAELPKLSLEGNFKKHRDRDPAVVDFMINKVTPQMAALVGEHPYDAKTQQGFSCFECHTKAE